MISLKEYLTEFKQDLMPQCVVVMGGPGAGKTYWMDHDARKFFQNNITYKKLDTDHNLEKYQKKHAESIAENLLRAILPNAVSEAKSRKRAFNRAIEQEQKEMDAAVGNGTLSPTTDISYISYNFVRSWSDRYYEAQDSQKDKVMSLYIQAFMKEYFDDIFASDFSVRMKSKEEYKRHFQQKLKGEFEDIEFVGVSDVVIAITGDNIKKFYDIVEVCGKTHSISVVYLNVPEEMSIRQDSERKRSLGADLVKEILHDVHDTWVQLTDEFKTLGITQLIEMTTDPGLKHPVWKPGLKMVNIDLIKGSLKR